MKQVEYFAYSDRETDYLSRKDPILGDAIRRIGKIRRPVTPDLFEALISSIVSQQIAKKAYFTVWQRILALTGGVTPGNLLGLSREEIKSCGLSYKKVDWILTAAERVQNGELDLTGLSSRSDSEVIQELTKLPGIGVWSAEMLLIFSLQRPDVLSFGDLAIRRGISNLYGLSELSKNDFGEIRQRLSPCNSVASLYFWELSHEAKAEPLTEDVDR